MSSHSPGMGLSVLAVPNHSYAGQGQINPSSTNKCKKDCRKVDNAYLAHRPQGILVTTAPLLTILVTATFECQWKEAERQKSC